MDELGLAGPSQVTEYNRRTGEVRSYTIAPGDFDLERATLTDLVGGDVAENVRITRGILEGERGPRRNATLLNAGAGIYAADAAGSIAEGVAMAKVALDSGRAAETLTRLVALTTLLAEEANAASVVTA